MQVIAEFFRSGARAALPVHGAAFCHYFKQLARFTKLATSYKGGNSYVRRLLMHGARSVISHVRDKPDAKSAWIRQLVTRIGVNKACVAVANKMARVAWALLHTGAQYRKPVVLSI